MTIEARIAAYLDGELSDREASEVEAALADPSVAQLLSEELMLRELLATMPPDAAPEELIARLEDSLGVGGGVTEPVKRRLRDALAGSGRALRGPALAAARASLTGARVAVAGASTVRSSIDLVADLPLPVLSSHKPKPLWQRAASLVWRRRK